MTRLDAVKAFFVALLGGVPGGSRPRLPGGSRGEASAESDGQGAAPKYEHTEVVIRFNVEAGTPIRREVPATIIRRVR